MLSPWQQNSYLQREKINTFLSQASVSRLSEMGWLPLRLPTLGWHLPPLLASRRHPVRSSAAASPRLTVWTSAASQPLANGRQAPLAKALTESSPSLPSPAPLRGTNIPSGHYPPQSTWMTTLTFKAPVASSHYTSPPPRNQSQWSTFVLSQEHLTHLHPHLGSTSSVTLSSAPNPTHLPLPMGLIPHLPYSSSLVSSPPVSQTPWDQKLCHSHSPVQ